MSRLTVVSANLRRDGGGAAALGRRVVHDARAFAAERGCGFRVLHLDAADADLGPDVEHFRGRRAALALAVAGAQRTAGAVVFDHLGPARIQAWLPAPLRQAYALFLLGIEMAEPPGGDRRRALRRAALRLAISEHTRGLALRSTGLDSVVLHPALEDPATGAPDAAVLSRAGEGFFMIVGRLASSERYKGHELLFEALDGLPDARLVVVGNGDDRERLTARARTLGARVVFTGFVDGATRDALYARCRALVLPSRGEGFGLVYLEAMRAGRPCVALAEGPAAEIVLNGETGLLADASAASLRAALATLGASDVAGRMGAAGLRRYEAAFAPERFRDAFFGHLDALFGRAATRRAA